MKKTQLVFEHDEISTYLIFLANTKRFMFYSQLIELEISALLSFLFFFYNFWISLNGVFAVETMGTTSCSG